MAVRTDVISEARSTHSTALHEQPVPTVLTAKRLTPKATHADVSHRRDVRRLTRRAVNIWTVVCYSSLVNPIAPVV